MITWTRVVTHPLGLAGFALFLVFGYLAKVKSKDERRWLSPAAVCAAVLALGGSLILAYIQTAKLAASPRQLTQAPAQQQTNQVQQTTSGPGSPAVQGVQGDVTITVDQSTGGTKPKKTVPPKPDQTKK